MRVPLSWLREYVEVAADATPEHVLASFVSVGFEEEDVHRFEISGPVVVGQVLSIEPEPQKNGKTINWCQVDVGEQEPRGIVCGAHNFVVGDKVVAPVHTVAPDIGAGRHHRRRKARAFLVGPVHHHDRPAGDVARVVEAAHDLQARQHARDAVEAPAVHLRVEVRADDHRRQAVVGIAPADVI